VVGNVIEMVANDYSLATVLMTKADLRFHAMDNQMDALLEFERKLSSTAFTEAEDSSHAVVRTLLLVFLVSALISLAVTFYIKAAEQQLLRAKGAAEAANRAKSEFVAQYEPRDPHADERCARHGRTAVRHRLTETQHRYAQNIRNSGEALLNIVNSILDFSKIEAGKMELDAVEFDVRETTEKSPICWPPVRTPRGWNCCVRSTTMCLRWREAIRGGYARCSSIWSAMQSNSPSAAKSRSRSNAPRRAKSVCRPETAFCTSPCAIPALA